MAKLEHTTSATPGHVPVSLARDVEATLLLNRVSWGAVFAGVAVALVAQLVINLLGVGIGAATLDPLTGDNPSASAFSLGAVIWFLVGGILASLAGGYAAGRLSGQPKGKSASWHGLTSWAATTLVVFYLLTTSVGGLLGGAYGALTSTLGNVASTVGVTAQTAAQVAAPNLSDPFSAIERSLRASPAGNDPQALQDAAVASVNAFLSGDPAQAEQARERAAQALAAARGIPVEQARTEVQQYEQQYNQTVEQAKQQAVEAADAAARAVSQAALASAIALVIGAIAAWFGGSLGATRLARRVDAV
jgi:Skp family chaperone for outer membrane proteins